MKPNTPWENLLANLDAWIKEHGPGPIPQKAVTTLNGTTYPLGVRLTRQRAAYRAGTLPPERITDLEQRPGWTWTPKQTTTHTIWERHYTTVHTYYTQQGTLEGLHQAHPTADRWLSTQRTNIHLLTQTQRTKLQKIPTALADDRRSTLDTFLRAMTWWIDHHQDQAYPSAVPAKATIELENQTIPLGQMATRNRKLYTEGRLDPETTHAIEQLPHWQWNAPDIRLARFINAATQWLQTHAGPHIPNAATVTIDGKTIAVGRSAFHYQQRYATGNLPVDDIHLIEAIPGWQWKHTPPPHPPTAES